MVAITELFRTSCRMCGKLEAKRGRALEYESATNRDVYGKVFVISQASALIYDG